MLFNEDENTTVISVKDHLESPILLRTFDNSSSGLAFAKLERFHVLDTLLTKEEFHIFLGVENRHVFCQLKTSSCKNRNMTWTERGELGGLHMQMENEQNAQRMRARVFPTVEHFSDAVDLFRTGNSQCCHRVYFASHFSHSTVSWLTPCSEGNNISQRRVIVAMVEKRPASKSLQMGLSGRGCHT